ncbi:dynein axonemal assembly factor 6 [Perognathus longimembris pacificus]|uniref:dynein axonemal assembly factor 6 n=1 Tax=Perognathus longimembris pacificus TaxID=214514 RepID=UPI002018BEE4|nr:dynein axonemal assembly factor 6 [Perognathus longimembris pacificus]
MESDNMDPENTEFKSRETEMATSAFALQALSNLLYPEDEEDDFDSEQSSSTFGAMSPGNIGPRKIEELKHITQSTNENSEDIWDPEEVPDIADPDDMWDVREIPEHEIIFKQQVGTEDVYLAFTRKDPSTSCCQEIVVKIQLPGTNPSDIHIDVEDTYLDLRTPNKKLLLTFPQPVQGSSAKALFMMETGTLEVTINVQRDSEVFY